jgi:two-component system, OmpR family, alkaline phosphatase synthesis response regulator PhoP
MKRKIVIIDDEPSILEILEYNLNKEGYEVTCFENPLQALAFLKRHTVDMVLTDWLMPDMDGLDVCRSIRASSRTCSLPIFMLSCKNDEIDIVTALELGVDDFLTKPFRVKELCVRMKKYFKRQNHGETDKNQAIIRNGLRIDMSSCSAYIDDKRISLTKCEFKILHLLASKPDRVFARNEIIEMINDDENPVFVTPRSVDVQIVGLRKKMGSKKDCIETIRSFGYKFSQEDQ